MTDNALSSRFDTDWRKNKIDFLFNYKFTIAFENTRYDGYTTEKLLHPLTARSLPVYWGNRQVSLDFNKASFIDCGDYADEVDKIIERIIYLDTNDDEYLKMIYEEPMNNEFNGNELNEYREFILSIIKNGNKPYNRDPRNWAKRMSVDNMGRKEKIRYFIKGRI